MKKLSDITSNKDKELSQEIISRRELLRKGVAASVLVSLLSMAEVEKVFAAEREKSSKPKDRYKDVNFSESVTSDVICSCIHPASDYPDGCSQCGNALQSSWINSQATIKAFLKDVYESKITISDLSQVTVTNGKAIECGGHVADDPASIVKDESGDIQHDGSSGYCNADISEFKNIPIYRVQWIICGYVECVYGVKHRDAMWIAWFLAGKPDYS